MLFITPAEFDRRVDVILKLREEEARLWDRCAEAGGDTAS